MVVTHISSRDIQEDGCAPRLPSHLVPLVLFALQRLSGRPTSFFPLTFLLRLFYLSPWLSFWSRNKEDCNPYKISNPFSSFSKKKVMATPRRSARLANGNNNGSGNGSPLLTTTNGQHPISSEEDSVKDRLRSSASDAIKPKSFWTTYEVPRKLLHSSIGVVTLILNAIDPPTLTPLISSLSAGLVVVAGADVIRFKSPAFAKTYEAYLGPLMRDSERHKWNGVIWYLVGVIFVLALYPRDVAVLSILILSWADTAASTIGRLLSKSKYNPRLPARVCFGLIPLSPNKSLAGFIAAWMTGLIVAVGYYGGGPGGGGSRGGQVDWRVLEWRRGVAFTGSFVGCVAAYVEALDLPAGLDDNLTLPIVSGALVWAFLSFTSRFL